VKFLNVLFDNSELNEAKLYSAAHKCVDKPDTGITIQHKGAYNVIRDCAKVTTRYLPHYVFGAYTNPFQTLKGKFTKPDIEEFVKKCRDDYALNQLLVVILEKYKSENKLEDFTTTKQQDFSKSPIDTNDPYGYYGDVDDEPDPIVEKISDVDILCRAFSVP
jgi:hypothetical protein